MSRQFSLLSTAIQQAIWDMGWQEFTPIQEMAIPMILHTNDHIILSAGTASGKTEAALLPILGLVSEKAKKSLQVLYISPLKALINDQFHRIEQLCSYVDIEVHKWHGDVAHFSKQRFRESPKGILQITPESLESLFVNRPALLHAIFGQCSFVVIDEVHAFIGTERGVQLRSLLDRINHYTARPIRLIALSATLNDDGSVRRWMDSVHPNQVQLLEAGSEGREVLYSLCHYVDVGKELPLELYEDIRQLTRNCSAMIFCNQRARVEEAAVILNRLAKQEGQPETYLVHHSSIDQEDRQMVEQILKRSESPRSVICTSTLELGIDIGNIDLVVQLDTTYSVSSLKQRIGRTGRRGQPQMLQMYTTRSASLLQAIAVTELFLSKWVEPPEPYAVPYDVLFHQIISICAERNGVKPLDIYQTTRSLAVFDPVEDHHIHQLLNHMLEKKYLEAIPGSGELIVGLEGERILRRRDFYTVFQTNRELEVYHVHKRIGSIGVSPEATEGANIILGGKLWTIESVNEENFKVMVLPAANGNPPIYFSNGRILHQKIAEKMMEILCSHEQYAYLNEKAANTLQDMRQIYHRLQLTPQQRLIFRSNSGATVHLFAGTRIASTLITMLRSLGYSASMNSLGHVRLNQQEKSVTEIIRRVQNTCWIERDLIPFIGNERMRTKYSRHLPQTLQDLLHISGQMAINETMYFLQEVMWKEEIVTHNST